MVHNFAVRSTQGKLANENDLADFVKEKDFDKESLNKKITSNKTKHVEVERKLTDLIKKFHKYEKNNIIFC